MATTREKKSSRSAPRRAKLRQGSRPHRDLAGTAPGEDANQFMLALGRGIEVLGAFKAGDGPLGNAELAERANLPKPTVSRITYTLTKCGYLNFDSKRRLYELGGGALALGRIALANMDIRRLARPLMQELASQGNFNVGLGTRDRDHMIYVEACEGRALVGLRLFAGSRIPIVTSAMGRAYLAAVDESERERLLKELRPRYGDEWPTLLRGCDRAARDLRTRGFCMSLGEWQKDINGAAVPIHLPEGEQVYAVNLGGPAYMLKEKHLIDDLGPRLVRLAAELQRMVSKRSIGTP